MRRSLIWPGFVLCFAAGVTMMWGYDQSATGRTWLGPTPELYPSGSWSDTDASVPVSSADPTWGARAAPVTVVEFSDLTCGHCLQLEGVLAQLRERYGPAQLRVVWKHLPHPANAEAVQIHAAAEAVFRTAGPKAFWEFQGALVRAALGTDEGPAVLGAETERTPSPVRDSLEQTLERLAAEAGAPPHLYQAELTNPAVVAKIRDDGQLARKLGVRGTPTCYVNGVAFSGVKPPDEFGFEVDQQLVASRALRLRGTPSDQIYVALTNSNRRPDSSSPPRRSMALLEP